MKRHEVTLPKYGSLLPQILVEKDTMMSLAVLSTAEPLGVRRF